MTQDPDHAQTPKAVQPDLAAVEARLEDLSSKLERIADRLPPYESPEQKRARAQSTATLAMALVGAKLGGVLGTATGTLDAVTGYFKKGAEAPSGKSPADKLLFHTGFLALIGMIAGGALGHFRGKRIDDPAMLWQHPIDSLKIMLGKEPKAPEALAQPAPAATQQAIVPPETLQDAPKPQKSWRATETARPVSMEGGLVR